MEAIARRRGLAAILVSLLPILAPAQAGERTIPLNRGSLCVTEGEIGNDTTNQLTVDTTKMRAYANTWTSDAIYAHFTYIGGTAEESALGSGIVRRQFGLKLRAQNACNLVYAMWRIEPESKIVVSIKKNPGQSMSSECGNRGYQNIKPRRAGPVPSLRPGETHTLGAELRGDELRVMVDGNPVWEGDLGPESAGLTGPVGIRSDNVRLAFDLKAGSENRPHPHFQLPCKSGPGASD
jgi:hypothetical protein